MNQTLSHQLVFKLNYILINLKIKYPEIVIEDVWAILEGPQESKSWDIFQPSEDIKGTVAQGKLSIHFVHALHNLPYDWVIMMKSLSHHCLTHNVQGRHFKHLMRAMIKFSVGSINLALQLPLNLRHLKWHPILHLVRLEKIKLVEQFQCQATTLSPVFAVTK